MAKFEFAIKKDVLNSGKVIFTPVCRQKGWAGIFGLYLYNHPWIRITEIYGDYILMDLDWTPELTFEQCEKHIEGYQAKLDRSIENNLHYAEFQNLEERQY